MTLLCLIRILVYRLYLLEPGERVEMLYIGKVDIALEIGRTWSGDGSRAVSGEGYCGPKIYKR